MTLPKNTLDKNTICPLQELGEFTIYPAIITQDIRGCTEQSIQPFLDIFTQQILQFTLCSLGFRVYVFHSLEKTNNPHPH